MKKTFVLVHPKIKYDRQVEAVRHEINKYIKRERHKELPEGVDYWDFDCAIGATPEETVSIHLAEIPKHITTFADQQLDSFYLEILAKPGIRQKS